MQISHAFQNAQGNFTFNKLGAQHFKLHLVRELKIKTWVPYCVTLDFYLRPVPKSVPKINMALLILANFLYIGKCL